MRRLLACLTFAVAAVTALSLSAGASAQSVPQQVVLAPAEGTLLTRYVFDGAGFVPGRTVSVRVFPPDGIERRMRNEQGAELVWLVSAAGGFALDFVPALIFPEATAGRWRVLFCQFGAPTCQQIDFDISP